jgi:hypothetical protein
VRHDPYSVLIIVIIIIVIVVGNIQAYGYQILQTLITDLDPDQRVKNAMNEINSSKRLKFAIAERAEGDKILHVCVTTTSR